MRDLGPWPIDRRVAVAVSGGADSLALAFLVRRWSGNAVALVVDHGLRAASAVEAARTLDSLERIGLPARLLRIDTLGPGTRLQERARNARHAALAASCRELGLLDLLLGHHAADQAETVRMRAHAGSGPDGLAGMSRLSERNDLRLIRPLLSHPPARLRATLRAAAIPWIEDPSNTDLRFERARLRAAPEAVERRNPPDTRPGAAEWLARNVTIHEAGYAILPPGPIPPAAFSRLIRTLSGREHPPRRADIARLAADPRPATLHGVRILAAGRHGPGLLACREHASVAPAVPARPSAAWDGRFRLVRGCPPTGWTLGPLGRHPVPRDAVPGAVGPSLPALRDEAGRLRCVPHLGGDEFGVIFTPALPAAPSFFWNT
jgi:tRNA(Ile)-lysidine synthase